MQRAMHLERDDGERAGAKRDICGDVRFVRIRGPDDDQGPAEGNWAVSRKANGVSPGWKGQQM